MQAEDQDVVMPFFCSDLYKDLELQLENTWRNQNSVLYLAQQSVRVTKNIIEQLKEIVGVYRFEKEEDEIFFFKEVKPLFYSKLIYYVDIFRIELRRPTGSNKTVENYIYNELNRLKSFFENHLPFYEYYRSGLSHLDKEYFLRGKHNIDVSLDSYYFNTDVNFCTGHDYTVSRILANEQVRIYLNRVLEELSKTGQTLPSGTLNQMVLTWTASKAALIEVMYALQSAGTFNNGAADLKQLAVYFEQAFNIKLGNYYNVFQEMRIRKKNRTSFLDQLKERLIRRMDEADEKV